MPKTTANPRLTETARTALHRHPERGSHELEVIHAIIDEALLCHVAFVHEGSPCVLPTAHARIGRQLYLHGAQRNRMLRAALAGPSCVSFTLLDGLVLARSAMHHSLNYRSAVLFAQAEEVTDPDEQLAALSALLDHMAPGRSREARPPSAAELRTTLVLRLPIDEASAKARAGAPVDAADDLGRPDWAGILPLRQYAGAPIRDPQLSPATPVAPSVRERVAQLGSPLDAVHEWRKGEYLVSTERARLDVALIHRFLCEDSYWVPGITRERVERAIANSVCFGLYRGAEPIGFARVATDFARGALLADVFVLPSMRRQGLGCWLIECVLAHPALADVDRFLLGTRDAHGFYARFGFEPGDSTRLMVRSRPAER